VADAPQQKRTSEILDQSEIDRLLADTLKAPQFKIYRHDGSPFATLEGLKIDAYDFRNPVFLTEIELRRLRMLHEDFIRYLSARLSLFLRMEFSLKMARLTTLTYEKFTESLPSPTHISLFKAEPLLGVGIIDVNPRLALTVADRMLGGRGHSIKVERYLTEIEVALIEDVLMILLEEWCNQWRAEQELRPLIIGHENSGRFLQTSPKNAIVLVLALEAAIGDCSEQIQIGVPYYTIEPVVKKMQARRQKETEISQIEKKAAWLASYDGITVPVRAEWQAFELTAREISLLRVGDVVELPPDIIGKTRVSLAGTPKFTGRAGQEEGRVAVELTGRLENQDKVATKDFGNGR
jgi:flagellar motor switch protein FliM